MGKLVYTANTSLDGFIEDSDGKFIWFAPDQEVSAFINDRERAKGTYLLGRRMYEIMVYWETEGTGPDATAEERDFAEMWRAAEKIVYSRTLQKASWPRTRVESHFDADTVRKLKQGSKSDLSIAGADLTGQAMNAGLVDEIELYLSPILVGGGKPALPVNSLTRLVLVSQRRFESGIVHLHYQVKSGDPVQSN